MADDTEPDDIQALIEWLVRGELRKGSPRELQARRTLTRMLRSEPERDLWGLRFILADAFDPDGEGGQRLFLKRTPGRRRRINDRHVAAYIYQRKQAGVKLESAVKEVTTKFNVSRSTAIGAWTKWRPYIERYPKPFARI
jgi:hypothetical protein